ncbi:caspase family protein, partial [Alphaproteobacteria bacterium]|nr:caspase family protein [Alphaproteobacteria bacterium]
EQERRRVELAEAMRKAEEVERRRKEVAEAKRKAEEVERRRLQLAEIKRKAEEEERRLNKLMAELAEEKRKAEEEERRRVELAEARRARDIEEQKLKRMKEELELKLKALASAKDQGSESSQSRNISTKSEKKKSVLVKSDRGHRKAKSTNRHAVAVIIGNRDYKGKTGDVDFAERDAQAMRDFVVNKLNYREGNIIDLRNATQAELRTTFGSKDMHKGKLYNYVRAGKSDVVVFYSGHGVPGLKDRRGYLLPVDGEPNLAELSAYSIDILLKNLAKIPARSITVFLDACFSGDSPKGMIVRATSGLSVEIKRPKTVDAKMVVITASKDDQFASWDEDAKHGLFTKHIIEGLSGVADSADFQGNGDGKVTVGELKAYLDDEMSYQARRRFNRDQNATVRGNLKTVLSAY